MYRIKDQTPIDSSTGPTTIEYILTKTDKARRIYEDEDFIIDLMRDEKGKPMLRVSIFDETGHWLDEEFVRKSDYLD